MRPRKYLYSWGILLEATTVLILAWPLSLAAAQKGKTPAAGATNTKGGEPASLTLGTVAGPTDSTVGIPFYYSPAKDTPPLRSLHVEVEFVSNSVKFVKAEKGAVSTAGTQDYDLVVVAKELPPDDKKLQHTRLLIDVSIVNPDSRKSLPQGLLAFLNFNIPADAKPFAISLNAVSTVAKDASEKPVEVVTEAGKIIVEAPDVPIMVGCFFFSH